MIAGSCSVGFTVPDIEKSFRQLQSKGVSFVMPPKAREGEGIKLAIFLDPDGLPISLSETIQQTSREGIVAKSA
jgi:predicted enzyme related to lactoylglutathione lyase